MVIRFSSSSAKCASQLETSQGIPGGSMLKKPRPGGSREVLLSHGPEWNALRVSPQAAQARQQPNSKLRQRVFSIRNGRLSGRDEVLSRSKKGSIIINHVFSEAKKNYGLIFTLHLAFFYFFLCCNFPLWMAFGRFFHPWPLPSPSQPWAKKEACLCIAFQFTGSHL